MTMKKQDLCKPILVQVDAGYFCAGVTVLAGTIIKAAPILKKYKGAPFSAFIKHARSRNWKVTTV